jgi:serine/threonine protein kinase
VGFDSYGCSTLCCNQALSIHVGVKVLQQCAAGLHHLHTHGILHRDLRTANVLVSGRDPIHVVIADFGVSHQLSTFAEPGRAGRPSSAAGPGRGASVGTVLRGAAAMGPGQWMAPEVLDGDGVSGRIASPASDVYMFGGLMFEVRAYTHDCDVSECIRREVFAVAFCRGLMPSLPLA